MNILSKYLSGKIGGLYKILPIKERHIEGADNHLETYVETVILNMRGAIYEYPQLKDCQSYLDIINGLQFLLNNESELKEWKRIVLSGCAELNYLAEKFKEVSDE